MTILNLTRDLLRSGDYLRSFRDLPEDRRWTLPQIEDSLARTYAGRPPGERVWLFAYGSLMWNPLLHFVDCRKATLFGWRRSFCLDMTAGRASNEAPGRMLALESAWYASQGVAFLLPDKDAVEELRLVWIREMVTGAYQPIWTGIALDDGSIASAITFVADPARPQFRADSSIATVAPLIANASGPFGSNADYLFELEAALTAHGLQDGHISGLAAEVRRLSA